MFNAHRLPVKQGGLSFVELMITITIGLTLTISMTTIIINSQQHLKFQQTLFYLSDKLRLAQQILTHDIHLAGHLGCNNSYNVHLQNHLAGLPLPVSAVYGYAATSKAQWRPTLPRYLHGSVVSHNDVISLYYAAPPANYLQYDLIHTTSPLSFATKSALSRHQLAIISDCQHAELFLFNANSHVRFFHIYHANTQINAFIQHNYFIRQTVM
ncbi:MAG: hypothetical protein JKY13_01440, partial [Gammaproteobacteria bacterium]|nr:hypothetical protein [Gammaproteobacteria bacterium]